MMRRGLSLLEVILAIAILALSMAAIGELIRIGTISASRAEEYTQAQILADSKLSEIMSGAITADPVTRAQFPTQPDWYYTIELAATEQTEVMELRVTVETHIKRARPLAFSLTRWIPDPGIELPEETEEPEEPESEDQTEEEAPTPEIPNGNGGGIDEDDLPELPNGFGQGGRP
jgi:prepilin-type N-terminal cleavage/methylation domain-containing protein